MADLLNAKVVLLRPSVRRIRKQDLACMCVVCSLNLTVFHSSVVKVPIVYCEHFWFFARFRIAAVVSHIVRGLSSVFPLSFQNSLVLLVGLFPISFLPIFWATKPSDQDEYQWEKRTGPRGAT